ncbi:DUF6538 domain-containing protein [Gluconobacter albidus]|nr:DUF6538 domain-containing protein [Gluconobacter albidus]
MLKRKNGCYHFRRVVPSHIRDALGQTEIWLSLGTHRKRDATSRAGMIYGQVENLFCFLSGGGALPEKFDLKNYLLEMVKRHPSDFKEDWLAGASAGIDVKKKYLSGASDRFLQQFVQDVDGRNAHLLNEIQRLGAELEAAKAAGNHEREGQLLALLGQAISKIPDMSQQAPAAPVMHHQIPPKISSVPFRDIANRYLEIKRASVSIETYNHFVAACSLFGRFTDTTRELHTFTRKDSSAFINVLRQMPKYWGKSPKEETMTLGEIVAYHRTRNPGYVTLSTDTMSRHINKMAEIWSYAISIGELDDKKEYDIWSKHMVTAINEQTVDRRPFKETELAALMETLWKPRININTVRQIISVATYTGMRLEEICRLRPCDIHEVEGVLCFDIRIHRDADGKEIWNPKSEAGERLIPVHSYIKNSTGLIERAKNCEKSKRDRIFFDLPYAASTNKYGAAFSQRFSKFKKDAGLPRETTFHSFRHLFRTMLGHRSDGLNYPVEWIDQILGHETAGMGSHYNAGTTPSNLMKVVRTVKFESWDPMEIKNR